MFTGQKTARCGHERPSATPKKNEKKTSDPPQVPQNNAGVYLLEAVKCALHRGHWEVPHGAARRGVVGRGTVRSVAHARGGMTRAVTCVDDARARYVRVARTRVTRGVTWRACMRDDDYKDDDKDDDDDEDEDENEDKDKDEDEEKEKDEDEDEDERCGAVGRARACGDAHYVTNITPFARHAHVTRERMTCGVM